MSELVVDFEANGHFKDSTGEIQYINRKSKKGGETVRRAASGMQTVNLRVFLQEMRAEFVQKFYINGFHDRVITNRRKEFLESEGKFGISKTEALEWYRFIYKFLTAEQLANRNPSFDNFTEKELGLEVKK